MFGRKFLRDSDRPHLATRAYQTCHKLLSEKASEVSSLNADGKLNLLMKIWQTTSLGQQLHLRIEGDIANKSLVDVFKALKGGSVSEDICLSSECACRTSESDGLTSFYSWGIQKKGEA